MNQGVTDNASLCRFELRLDDQVVFADYRRQVGGLTITHVYAPPALRGSGAAGRLMRGLLELARAEGLKVTPVCPYARLWMDRHPEFADLLA